MSVFSGFQDLYFFFLFGTKSWREPLLSQKLIRNQTSMNSSYWGVKSAYNTKICCQKQTTNVRGNKIESSKLSYGKIYYARVRGFNKVGWGEWLIQMMLKHLMLQSLVCQNFSWLCCVVNSDLLSNAILFRFNKKIDYVWQHYCRSAIKILDDGKQMKQMVWRFEM